MQNTREKRAENFLVFIFFALVFIYVLSTNIALSSTKPQFIVSFKIRVDSLYL